MIKFQLSQEVAGFVERLDLPVSAAKVRIGMIKAPAESGAYELAITYGGVTVETAPISCDATAVELQGIVNAALTGPLAALTPCVVAPETGGAYRLHFANNTVTVGIVVSDNSLWPLSFVDVEEQAHDEGYTYIIAHQQTPVAEDVTLGTRAPDLPVVTSMQVGTDADGIVINEIQRLTIPPSFAGGTFRLARDGVKSALLPLPLSIAVIADAIAATADEGGTYLVTSSSNAFFIEFRGTMAGQPQPLFTVVPFDVPPSDYYLKLGTRTAAMAARMRRAGSTGEVELPLHLTIYVENEIDGAEDDRHDFSFPLTFTSAPGDDEHEASIDLIWAQPPSRLDVLPHSPDAVLVGHRSYRVAIGNGAATSFSIPHNLSANPRTVTADAAADKFSATDHNFYNGDAVTFASTVAVPAPLVAGTTYWVTHRSDDDFQVSTLQGGPVLALTDAGTGTITARVDDGPGDGFHVTVYEREGTRTRLPDDSYTVALTSADALTISGFATVPTANQYVVLVSKVGRPASYQALELPIARVIGLQDFIDATQSRLAALEGVVAPGVIFQQASRLGGVIDRPLPRVWSVMRARQRPADPGALLGWDPFAEGSTLRDIRLLPAVHLAPDSVEVLPALLPAPDLIYRGRVFYTATDRPDFPGGILYSGQYVACDGRDWYRVARASENETTWYPTLFDLELFAFSISPDELALRTRLDLLFGIEAAMYRPQRRPGERKVEGRWSLLLERGIRLADGDPATTGSNIDTHFADPVVLARHDFDLTEVPVSKRFGLTITRAGDGTLAAEATKFYSAATVSPPATADFAIRARLARWDIADLPLDARGIVAVRGLDVGTGGLTDNTLGRYTIS